MASIINQNPERPSAHGMAPSPFMDRYKHRQVIGEPREYGISTVLFFLAASIMPIICLASESPVYSAIGGAMVLLGIHLVVPACRPGRPYLSPYNWALALFVLELVLVPVNMMVAGVKRGTLPSLPSGSAIEYAYLLTVLGYTSFSASYWLASRQPKRRGRAPAPWTLTSGVAAVYVALGLVGVVLVFSGRSASEYYASGAGRIVDPSATTTLAGAASTFLRPFLAFGVVAIWSRLVDARHTPRFNLLIGAITCACVVALVYSTYGYNRATIAAPLVCLAAVVNRHIRRLPLSFLFCAGPALLVVLLFMGQYRLTSLGVGQVLGDEGATAGLISKINFSEELQVYSNGPQFAAYFLEATRWGEGLPIGEGFAASLVYTVPILGKTFRPYSGVALYNSLIYGNTTTVDQPVPFTSELFINFHIVGIILGYGLLGFLVHRIQSGFEEAASSLKTFCLLYLAIWLCYAIHSSAMVVSQMLMYFCSPIYGIVLLMWLRHGARGHIAVGR